MTVKVKVGLSIGFPTATREDTLEFEDGVTQAQVDCEVREWAHNYIEYYGGVIEGEVAPDVCKPKLKVEPCAYEYELATVIRNGVYSGWKIHLTKDKPNVPEGSVRNLTPLYKYQPPVEDDHEPTT